MPIPTCVRMRVSQGVLSRSRTRSGGTIYTWTLGADKTAHAVAREHGHWTSWPSSRRAARRRSGLHVAGAAGDETAVSGLLASRPSCHASPTATARSSRTRHGTTTCARSRQCSPPAGRSMLAASTVRRRSTGPPGTATPHDPRELLRPRAPVDVKGDEYDGTPLSWAVYGSVHGWRCETGDYAGAVETLLAAGAHVRDDAGLTASDAVRAVLARHAG